MKFFNLTKRIVSAALVGAIALSLTACSSSSSSSSETASSDAAESSAASTDSAESSESTEKTTLRLAYHGSLCGAPLYIGIEKGFFEEEGIEIEQVNIDAAHVSEAIGADQVDVGMGLIGKFLQPLENGLPIKFTTGIHTGCIKLLVPADSDIKSITDLKGKNVGVPGLADAGTIVTKRSLFNAGIDVTEGSSEVDFTVFSRNDLPQALENGAVDAIVLGDPQASVAQEEYNLSVLIDTASDEEYKDEYCCAAFVTTKLAEENPEAAAAFTRAVQKASQWVQDNPEEAAQIITEKNYVSGEADFAASVLSTYNYKPSVQGGYDALKLSAEQLSQIGILSSDTDATAFADNAYAFFDGVEDTASSSESSVQSGNISLSASTLDFVAKNAAKNTADSSSPVEEEDDCCGGK